MIGFDIGGTKCSVTVGEEQNGVPVILAKTVLPTDLSVGPYEMIERMCRAAEEMTNRFHAVGISCGGPLDAANGVILSPPNLPGWDNVPICRLLQKRWGASCYLQNDANACALAEWQYGAGRGCRSMVFLTFGTGLGSGLILNGKLYEGANGNAGEVGHLRLAPYGPVGYGKSGSFEGFCSGGGIASLARTRAEEALQRGKILSYCRDREQLGKADAKYLADLAKSGDADAMAIWEECGEKLGEGLALLVDILNPERIVIGSIFQRASELLIPSMEKALHREALAPSLLPLRILPAELTDSLGDMAALACAHAAEKEKKNYD